VVSAFAPEMLTTLVSRIDLNHGRTRGQYPPAPHNITHVRIVMKLSYLQRMVLVALTATALVGWALTALR
jgi:hypothetical protein